MSDLWDADACKEVQHPVATAIGMIETSSLPTGIKAADAMMKAGPVELVTSRTICPGKYITIVAGDVGAVRASLAAGLAEAGNRVKDKLLLPSVHPSVIPAFHLKARATLRGETAVGAVETRTVASAIVAADAAVKASPVQLLGIRLGMAYGGKGYFVVAGAVSAVEAAIAAGVGAIQSQALLDKIVIPHLHPDLIDKFI